MNERIINELVTKARTSAITWGDQGGKCFDLDVFNERLVMLVVEECVKLLKAKGHELSTHADTDYDDGVADGMTSAAGLLQRTFSSTNERS